MAFTRPADNTVPDPIPESSPVACTTPTGSPATPRKTLWQVQGGCLWPVGQITCRHERDLEAYR